MKIFKEMEDEQKESIIKILITLILFIVASVIPEFTIMKTEEYGIENSLALGILIKSIIYIIAYIVAGFEVIKEAFEDITHGEVFGENFLMTVATIGAIAIGEFPEAVLVMFLYDIGELFEDIATDKSRKSITELMNIRPDKANVIRDDKTLQVSPEEVKIDEIIEVKPGEKIPLDGIVVSGNALIDTSALTGESVPRKAEIGNNVLSGCINTNGVLRVKVTKLFGESTVSKILDLVENAADKKSKSENFITKFSKVYTPTVVVLALLLAIVPIIAIKNANAVEWIYRALSFLVVSCPCALVISVPLSFFGGIGGAAKKGILIKGSNYLETLSKVDTVVFDKTGTLTKGVFKVQKINAVEGNEKELLRIAAYCESFSSHPIAVSIIKEYNETINKELVTDVTEVNGRGIRCNFEGNNILIGNNKLLVENGVEFEETTDVGTIVYIAKNQKYLGSIVIADEVKDDAKNAIQGLKKNGVTKTVMLTGDKKAVAENVAKQLNIDEYSAELLPADKVDRLEELLKEENGKLAFVGDGINDSPVLARADIGIAMGGLGADSSIEAADIVIMTDEPSKIIDSIKISRKTMRIVKENIIFAIVIKIAVLILSAVGIATMWEAVFADVVVTIIAIINALRALKN